MTYALVRALIRLLLPFQMRLRVKGAERCPRTGPVIIVANHLGLLDPIVAGVRVRRQIHFLAKAEMFEWPFIGGAARACGVIPIRRGASDREALRALEGLLSRGQCVMLMPEGTYPKVPLPPAMLRAKTGAAFLALRTGATVLPVGITGTERVWYRARGWKVWHRPRVTVTFGEPYTPRAPAGLSAKAAYQALADDMGRRIAALLPEAYRGYYASSSGRAAALPAGLPHEQGPGEDGGVE
jgi:1-acyl-sn-glycerol-3-phosphate acyltransferase